MNDTFENGVRAAAVAGWWTLLMGAGFLTLLWITYLIMSARPTWLLFLWGPDASWLAIQNVWFWGMAIFKFCLWLLTLMDLWLTLSARQLGKWAGSDPERGK